MDPFKKGIRSNKTKLTNVLSRDAKFVLQHVQEKDLLADREYNHLRVEHGENLITELLDKLMNKGDPHCQRFISILREDEMVETFPELTEILQRLPAAPYQAAAEAAASDTPVQEAGLEAYKMTSVLHGSCVIINNVDQVAAGAAASDTPVQQAGLERYKMNHSPRGICVIINNVDFVKEGKKRYGSDKDADSLKNVFAWLGFTVEPHRNKTVDEMKHVLKESSQRADGDCFICCVLSHGGSKGVSGCDDKVLPMEEILSPFRGHVCQRLVGKPKLFFIQACRGGRIQERASLSSDSAQKLDTDADPSQMITIPTDADFLVCKAIVDDYKSFRDPSEGSWFIQSLCSQLKEGVPRGDNIWTILTRVNSEVSKKKGRVYIEEEKRCEEARQIPQQEYTFTKDLVFPNM